MALYEVTADLLCKLKETTFIDAGILERSDLQRLLRTEIKSIFPDILIIAEEFSEWQDNKRRIDLLGIDTEANLVVIELKRTEDGGFMDLQAIRYAAMVSAMTFDKAVDVYAAYLAKNGSQLVAKESLLTHLQWKEGGDSGEPVDFGNDVRLILFSAEFSKELTTTVLWLNNKTDLDIRCVRMKPYNYNGKTLIDIQQVIPLPEAADYMVQIKEKERKERQEQADRFEFRKRFWTGLLTYAKSKTELHAGISPSDNTWASTSLGVNGLALVYGVKQHESSVKLYIDFGHKEKNKQLFDVLFSKKAEIEADFGGALTWERGTDRRSSDIYTTFEGGYRDEQKLPQIQEQLVDAMIRLDKALRPPITQLKANG